MDFNFILLFLDTIFCKKMEESLDLWEIEDGLGSDDPNNQGCNSLQCICSIWIWNNVNFFNAAVRKKMVDQVKLKRIMKETRAWQKERMAAMRSKDQAKTD